MNILEFQAKKLCKEYGIPIPKSILLHSADSLKRILDLRYPILLKAQVLSTKRTRTGGMYLARSMDEAKNMLPEMLTANINGHSVEKILAEELIDFDVGFRIEIAYSRAKHQIEFSVAQSFNSLDENQNLDADASPGFHFLVNPFIGIRASEIFDAALVVGMEQGVWDQFSEMVHKLWALYQNIDAEKIIIDPLVISHTGEIFALGVDVMVDENALVRQPGLVELIEFRDADPIRNNFRKIGCTYVEAKGDICVAASSMESCRAIQDIIIPEAGEVSELLSFSEDLSREKISVALKMIEENGKSNLIIFYAGDPNHSQKLIHAGINTYIANSIKTLPIILCQEDGEYPDGASDVHVINSLSDLVPSIITFKSKDGL